MIITGRNIDAEDAYRIGLVSQVVPLDSLIHSAKKIAHLILKNGPNAIASSLDQVNLSAGSSLEEGLEREVQAFADLFETDETREGLKAFVEKRPPEFR